MHAPLLAACVLLAVTVCAGAGAPRHRHMLPDAWHVVAEGGGVAVTAAVHTPASATSQASATLSARDGEATTAGAGTTTHAWLNVSVQVPPASGADHVCGAVNRLAVGCVAVAAGGGAAFHVRGNTTLGATTQAADHITLRLWAERAAPSSQATATTNPDDVLELAVPRVAAGTAEVPTLVAGRRFPSHWTARQSPAFDSGTPRNRRWVVITSINQPTESVRVLDALPGWRVVVVGDLKSSTDVAPWAALRRTTFLDVPAQLAWAQRMGMSSAALLPFNHYARKNLGYLYAVAHGAETVYDTDDDNLLLEEVPPGVDTVWFEPAVVPAHTAPELHPYDAAVPVVNPMAHFGRPDVWPRGYPLHLLTPAAQAQHLVHSPPTSDAHMTIPVQQLLAAKDPDTDAIFRLTRATDVGSVWFNTSTPHVVVPRGVLTPVNSQSTVFHHDALWGLLVPVSVPFRVCDIWRGYWLQRVLWATGGQVAVLPKAVVHERNAHDYMADFADEVQLYLHAGSLVDRLAASWRRANATCAAATPDVFQLAMQVAADMHVGGYWGVTHLQLASAWLSDLWRLGYRVRLSSCV